MLEKTIGRVYRFMVSTNRLGFTNAVKIFFIDTKLNKLSIFGHNFFYRGRSDAGVITHFYKEGYVIKDNNSEKKINTIIDAGANIGDETFRFFIHNKGAKIIAIEAEKDNFNILEMNFKNINTVNLLNKGLWSTKAKLKVNKLTNNESFYVHEVENNSIDYDIEAYDLSYIINKYNFDEIDILKLDIECAEYEILSKNYEQWIDKVNCFIFEVSDCDKSITQLLFERLNDDFTSSISGENIVLIRKSTNWNMINVIGFE
jgi:FkbM family methyltransferase